MFGTGGNLRSAAVVLFTFAAASFGQPTEARAACVHSRRPGHRAELDWGDDILVGSVDSGFSIVDLSTDADTNGDIYVTAVARSTASGDILHAWRSTNGGTDWTDIYRIRSDTSTGGIKDHSIIVGHDASGTWLYDFVLRDHEGPAGGLWLLRHRPPMQDSIWLRIAPGGDTIVSFSADRNIESPEHLFVAWETVNGPIYASGSGDSGETWLVPSLVHTAGHGPSISAGGDGCVYVAAARRDSTWISVARIDSNLSGSLVHMSRLDSAQSTGVWDVSIAADRDAPCSSQTAVMLYCFRDDSGRVVPRLGWTRNGGSTWGTCLWPAANQPRDTWETYAPDVRRSYDDGLLRAIATMYIPEPGRFAAVYSNARPENPTAWELGVAASDSNPSLTVGALTGNSHTTAGGYAVYTRTGNKAVYFDGYDFVGVKADDQPQSRRPVPTVFGGDEVVLFALDRETTGRISLFDNLGRMVLETFDGRFGPGQVRLPAPAGRLASGVYLCRLETTTHCSWVRLVVTR